MAENFCRSVQHMNENLKKYLRHLSADEAFAKKAIESESIEETISIAKKKGIDLTEQDIRDVTEKRNHPDPEFQDEIAESGLRDMAYCFFAKHEWETVGNMKCDNNATFVLSKATCIHCGKIKYCILAPDGKSKSISEAEYLEGLKLPPRDTWRKLSKGMK